MTIVGGSAQEARGRGDSLHDALIGSVRVRTRPILMAACSTGCSRPWPVSAGGANSPRPTSPHHMGLLALDALGAHREADHTLHVICYPGKTAVRYALTADFLDAFGAQEFFACRKRGVEPSGIPASVTQQAIDWTLAQPDDAVFAVLPRPDFAYQPPKGSFTKSKCSRCGEYVFERYVRWQDGRPVCIPCSGYAG